MSEIELVAAFRALHRVTTRVHESLQLTTTLDAVAQGVVDVAGFGVVVVNLIRPDGGYEVVSVAGDDDARRTLLGTVDSAAGWQRLLDGSQRLGNLRFVDHLVTVWEDDSPYSWVPDLPETQDDGAWHPLDALFAPLTSPAGDLVGILSVDMPTSGRRPDAEQLEVLALFADHAAIAIEHARLHGELQTREAQAWYAATHDPLTGLANRTLLMSTADEMAARPDVDMAVLLIDLDHFKQVNDSDGHRGGDEVLKAISSRLTHAVREGDVVARTGGDEFVVLMSGSAIAAPAAALAERLEALLAQPIRGQLADHRVGASVGLAVASTPVDVAGLLAAADAAMYAGKRERQPRQAVDERLTLGPGEAYRLVHAVPAIQDYLDLRRRSGLTPCSREQALDGLPGSWAACHVVHESSATTVAMGRVIGDGGWYFHVIDVAVLPEHQRRGIGDAVLAALLGQVRARAVPGALVNLLADPPGRRLYARHGFAPTAPDSIGMHLRLP